MSESVHSIPSRLQEIIEDFGWCEGQEKLELLRTVWAVVFASPKEGWGITNVEAALKERAEAGNDG